MTSLYRKPFSLEVLTPAESLCRLDAVSVTFPAADGQAGVLAGRAPLIAALGTGRLVVEPAAGGQLDFFLSGGLVHVRENAVIVLAEECVPSERLDRQEAWDQLQRARRQPAETAEQLTARERAVDTARKKFDVAQRHRRGMMRQ